MLQYPSYPLVAELRIATKIKKYRRRRPASWNHQRDWCRSSGTSILTLCPKHVIWQKRYLNWRVEEIVSLGSVLFHLYIPLNLAAFIQQSGHFHLSPSSYGCGGLATHRKGSQRIPHGYAACHSTPTAGFQDPGSIARLDKVGEQSHTILSSDSPAQSPDLAREIYVAQTTEQ